MRLRIGTRGSPLARWQADWVAASLAEFGVQVERIGATQLFVAPSTSGAANAFWDVEIWHELARRCDRTVNHAKEESQ